MSKTCFLKVWPAKLVLIIALIAGQFLPLLPMEKARAASEFTTAVHVSTQNAKPGDSVTITAAVTSTLTTSIHLQLQIVGSNATLAFQKWWTDLPVTTGETKEYSLNWIVPNDLPQGTYSVSLGIFGANWDRMYNWDYGLASMTIQSVTAAPVFSAVVHAPASVKTGGNAPVTIDLSSDRATSAAAKLEIYSQTNVKVYEQQLSNMSFEANSGQTITATWSIPPDAEAGTYKIQLTVTSIDGAVVYYRNENMGSFQVTGADSADSAVFVTRAIVGAASVKAGGTAEFAAEITSDKDVSVLVDVVVKSPFSGDVVFQKVLERQSVDRGAPLQIPIAWNIPADAVTGSYRVEIGIFGNEWKGPYHWNANAGLIQVSGEQTPQISFTASTEVTPTTVKAGMGQRIAVEATSNADAEALVSVTVLDPKGGHVFSKDFVKQLFTAREAKTMEANWTIPAGTEPGTYTVATSVYNADRSITYARNPSSSPFLVVGDSPPPSEQPDNGALAHWTTGATVVESVEAGYPVTVTANVVSDQYAKALVDVEIYNDQGKVYQSFVDDQYFQPNTPKQFPIVWNIPASQQCGKYTVKIGVFPAGWAQVWDHHWNGSAATFEVNWGVIPEITQNSTVAASAIVPGQKQTIRTDVTSSETLPATVRTELLDPTGNRVAYREYTGEQFTQGAAKSYVMDWVPPATAVNGDYKLKVSVAKADGIRTFYSHTEAAQFQLTGGIDLAYTLSAAAERSEVTAGQTLKVNARVGSTVPSVVSMKVTFIDVLTGEAVHSETLTNRPVSPNQDENLDIAWTLPKWIQMDEEKVRSGAEPLVKYVLDGDYRIDVELYNADMSYRILSKDGAASFRVVTPTDAAAPQPAEKPKLPDIMKLGVFATNNDPYGLTGWMPETGLPWNFAYRYLNGGVNNKEGWTAWDPYHVGDWRGAYAYDYAKNAAEHGYTPVFTFYQMLQSISGDCLNCDEAKDDIITLNDPYAMRAYFEEFKLLMQLIGTGSYNGKQGIGKTAIVHVDPDLAGYAQQGVLDNSRCYGMCTGQGNHPALLNAAVASTRMPELADLPNTFQGFNWALLRLRDKYAPNVLMAPHVNSWGTLIDVGSDTSPDLDVTALGKLAGEFASLSGAQTVPAGIKPYDYIFNDIDDDDAAGGRGRWLDRTNLTLPNFHRWEQFVKAVVDTTKKKAMIWQIPVGNQVYRAMNNTPGHYQDNKAEYLFTHMEELVNIGIVGLMFGHGQPGSTAHYNLIDDNNEAPPETDFFNPAPLNFSDGWGDGSVHTNDKEADYTDDDGGYLRIQAREYYRHPIPVPDH
ncbi:hypothetical protein [Paenibacillus rigui]|uniref:Uncharacterized protein n=1 Tax=Paenibacillus rigui TaxID=554312 RepID=A0A229UUB9_9BACL|nr:hypothetical protein [Paenibacillus rigui]OXM87002.1 hypothetical protein CF651_07625 [Paenibacillus rigui]